MPEKTTKLFSVMLKQRKLLMNVSLQIIDPSGQAWGRKTMHQNSDLYNMMLNMLFRPVEYD